MTNVYSGHHPTYETTPVIPHNGYLADFLMRNKGFIRDWHQPTTGFDGSRPVWERR